MKHNEVKISKSKSDGGNITTSEETSSDSPFDEVSKNNLNESDTESSSSGGCSRFARRRRMLKELAKESASRKRKRNRDKSNSGSDVKEGDSENQRNIKKPRKKVLRDKDSSSESDSKSSEESLKNSRAKASRSAEAKNKRKKETKVNSSENDEENSESSSESSKENRKKKSLRSNKSRNNRKKETKLNSSENDEENSESTSESSKENRKKKSVRNNKSRNNKKKETKLNSPEESDSSESDSEINKINSESTSESSKKNPKKKSVRNNKSRNNKKKETKLNSPEESDSSESDSEEITEKKRAKALKIIRLKNKKKKETKINLRSNSDKKKNNDTECVVISSNSEDSDDTHTKNKLKTKNNSNNNKIKEEVCKRDKTTKRSKSHADSDNKESLNEDSFEEKTFKNKKKSSKLNPDTEIEISDSNSEKEKKKKTSKKSKLTSDEEVDISDSDSESRKKKKTSKKSKLNSDKEIEISDSDSDDFAKFTIKRKKAKEEAKSKACNRRLKKIASSGSDSDYKDESHNNKSTSSESEKESNHKEKTTKKSRIKRLKESSSEEEEDANAGATRKQIRRVWKKDTLEESTLAAEKAERERKARIAERQKKYNQIFDLDKLESANVDKVVLDFNEETKEELLSVDKDLVKKLKPHQASGVKFMWDSCFESLDRIKESHGSGCILAHCMGLGKTLQVITLVHTLLNNSKKTGVSTVLIVCPLNTVLNWVEEFQKWLSDVNGEIDIYEIGKKSNAVRQYEVQYWADNGGVMVISYNMFRLLTNETNKKTPKKLRDIYKTAFLDPGPDLVVCDEGHLLKNEKTNLSIAMNKISTPMRIVLTGTPMQNNLKEYYCMVQFVKPNLLGTYKEYLNRFVNPITNGQYTDSTPHDIAIMKRRSHVLHKLLDGVIQRRDYSVLAPFLPPKYEYVLFITLSEVQINLYKHYLTNLSQRQRSERKDCSFLFNDFQELQRICTHPRVLLDKSIEERNKKMLMEDDESEGSLKDFIDDDESTASSTSSTSSEGEDEKNASEKQSNSKERKRITRGAVAAGTIEISDEEKEENKPKEWWSEFVEEKDLDKIELGSKLFLLFTILQQCEQIGDKVLIFSQSLYSLNVIEYFLNIIDEATQKGDSESVCGFSGSWSPGLDYFRIDGSSSSDSRQTWCNNFNNPENPRARLFLISTRAGGLGINLVAANRVIIFDVSWNPSHDTQSIYRVYRFGQTKPCYIYRFVIQGSMEMKIYERQVTKQAISKRVIDEQQIDRHYNQNDLNELYKFDPKPEGERPIPLVPKDVLLGELLQSHSHLIYQYHEHQSLLENREEEELNEEERKAAWEEFENEKVYRKQQQQQQQNSFGSYLQQPLQYNYQNLMAWVSQIPLPNIILGIRLLVKRDNPTWTDQQVQIIVPAVMQQLQEQITTGNPALLTRITDELRQFQLRKQQEQRFNLQVRKMQELIQQSSQAPPSSWHQPEAKSNQQSANQEVIELID